LGGARQRVWRWQRRFGEKKKRKEEEKETTARVLEALIPCKEIKP